MLIRSIVRTIEPFKIPIKTLPNLRDLIDGKVRAVTDPQSTVEDLLARPRSVSTREPLKQFIGGRRVMVTGAGGSIGSELCRQIARLEAGGAGAVRALREQPLRDPMELERCAPQFGVVPVSSATSRDHGAARGSRLAEQRPRSSSTPRPTSTCR